MADKPNVQKDFSDFLEKIAGPERAKAEQLMRDVMNRDAATSSTSENKENAKNEAPSADKNEPPKISPVELDRVSLMLGYERLLNASKDVPSDVSSDV